MVNVLIPIKGEEYFSLFAKGKIDAGVTVPEKGTFIELSGVCVLYFKYPHHRRAYIVRNADETKNLNTLKLPNVKQKVAVIYQARGRRIDLLRTAIWNLEKINGKDVYLYKTFFWQQLSCLLDNFNGKTSAAIKSNLYLLSNQYKGVKTI